MLMEDLDVIEAGELPYRGGRAAMKVRSSTENRTQWREASARANRYSPSQTRMFPQGTTTHDDRVEALARQTRERHTPAGGHSCCRIGAMNEPCVSTPRSVGMVTGAARRFQDGR